MRTGFHRALWAALLTAVLALAVGARPRADTAPPETARGTHGMVAAFEPFAAEAGLEILRKDGNAVDAAVAVGFALAVTHPAAGNLGGGGFMLVRLANGAAVMVDYREVAPAAATWDMYLDADGKLIPQSSTRGWRAAAVPGSVAGLALALEKYGSLSLEEVIAPAIRLAEDGFPVSQRLADSLSANASALSRDPESRRLFLRNGRFYQPGERLVQKDLARTLKKIAKKGAQEFYHGSLAGRLAAESKRAGGLLTRNDLSAYKPVLREPLRGSIRGYEILAASPPSSGGVALLESLHMLDTLLTEEDRPEKPETLHVLAEVLRRAFADRARYLADPDFATIPVAGLIAPEYAAAFAASISREHSSASAELERPDPLRFQSDAATADGHPGNWESDDTTHFSVMDGHGNTVACTTTINDGYGNKVTVPGLGFLLNNVMDDFTVQPGAANALFHLVQSDANKIEPGKRPLSSMTPAIVIKDGQPILALGSPGGGRIISAVIQVVLNHLFFGDDLPLAVARPRLHHQWIPDVLYLEEDGFSEAQVAALRARGHTVQPVTELVKSWPRTVGRVTAVGRDPETGQLLGVADGRDASVARGY